jgi:DNA repair exonuclease SbcCD ATPase subunit
MEEGALHRAIIEAVNSSMASKDELVQGITDTIMLMLKPQENAKITLEEVKRRIRELTAEFDRLFEIEGSESKYEKRFSEITKELAELKKQQEEISAQLRNNQGVQARIQRITSVADRMEHQLIQWDEETIRQIIHTVEVMSKDQIRVVLTDGTVVVQEIPYQ